MQLLVLKAAGVEELLERQAALLAPRLQLGKRGLVVLDVTLVIGDAVCVQPLFCLLTGCALGIVWVSTLIIRPLLFLATVLYPHHVCR